MVVVAGDVQQQSSSLRRERSQKRIFQLPACEHIVQVRDVAWDARNRSAGGRRRQTGDYLGGKERKGGKLDQNWGAAKEEKNRHSRVQTPIAPARR